MSRIQVQKPGIFTTIQDVGRPNYQRFGMPVGGAMDWHAAALANHRVGNVASAACLEFTYTGPTLFFENEVSFAITGADMHPVLNGEPIERNRACQVRKGDVLGFGRLIEGCRGYLAFAGGIQVPNVLGSKSTYLSAKLGGLEGRRLKAGDILSIGSSDHKLIQFTEPEPYVYQRQEIRVMAGPEASAFKTHALSHFLNTAYKILPESDRMAYRLSGETLELKRAQSMISSGTSLGTIQVPADGQPIVLMADRQTTGGYPRIANVIAADIPLLAQKKAGDLIHFREVRLAEAQELLNELKRGLHDLSE